jgi:hypothetical protein
MASLNRACRARPTLGARHRRVIHVTPPSIRNASEKISTDVRKRHLQKRWGVRTQSLQLRRFLSRANFGREHVQQRT